MKWQRIVLPVLLLLLGFSLNCFGAGGDIIRQTGDARTGKQEAKAAIVDKAGCMIITGYQNIAGNTDDDYWTVKFNANGTVAWRAPYNKGGGSDQATAIAIDSGNNVIVTGFVWNGTNTDIHTIKYKASDGTVLWQHTYNSPANGNDTATSIAVDELNNIYVGGYAQNAAGNEDYIIIKYTDAGPNPDGTPIWVVTYDGPDQKVDKVFSIAAREGIVAVTGQSQNGSGGSNFDVFTKIYDTDDGAELLDGSSQTMEWRYANTGPASGRKVLIDSAGNVIITAVVNNGSDSDIYTAKYNAAGTPIWANTVNFSGFGFNDEPYDMALDSSGNVYVTGFTSTATSNKDVYTVRYRASDGTTDWQMLYDTGSGADDLGTNIVIDDGGNVYVGGVSITTLGNNNFLALKYKGDNGTELWHAAFDGAFGKRDKPAGIGLGTGSELLVGGTSDMWTSGASDYDYYVVAFDAGAINAPSNLRATVLSGSTSAQLTWTNNSANADGFIVERKLGSEGAWALVTTTVGAATTFTDSGLTPNSTYYYRAKAYNAANGASNPSDETHVLTLFVTYQSPTWNYVYNSASNSEDYPTAIAVGPDNNPVVTGYSLATLGGFDYYTVKLNNSDGSVLWSDRYDDADSELDKATSVVVDSTNAAVVTGYSSLFPGFGEGNINSIYTIKYRDTNPLTTTPELVWDSQYNGPGGIDDRATAVAAAVDESDSMVVLGYGKNAAGNEDIYLVKYAANPLLDESGEAIPEWAATPYNGGGNDYPSAVAFDQDGDIFITGYSHNGTNYDIFTAKYDGSTGEMLWSDTLDGTGHGNDYGQSLAVDAAGNVYVTGSTTIGGGKTAITTIKYDGKTVPTAQRIIWQKTYSNAVAGADDTGVAIKYDLVDDTVVVGGKTLTAPGDHDFIVIRYDTAGNEVWRHIHLRPGIDDVASSMAMDVSGNVTLAGHTINGTSVDAMSMRINYEGTLIAATVYNGAANDIDEAKAVTINSLGETFVAGYTTNSSGSTDYLVYKMDGTPLQASSPFTPELLYTKVDLTWTDTSSGEEGFYVQRKIGACNSANPWILIHTALPNETTYSNTGLNIGEEYCYRVRSFKTGEPDPRWVERHVVLTSPVAPGNFVATPVNTTRIDLAWDDNTTGETGFEIYRCTGVGCTGPDYSKIGTAPADAISYSDTTVASGLTYSYKILAYRDLTANVTDWQSAFSTPASVTTPSPAAPTGLTATPASEARINLAWGNTNSDETGFKIERCAGASCGNFAQIGIAPAGALTYGDTISIQPGVTYRYQIRAYKTATTGWDGPYSNIAAAATTNIPPSGLVATTANTTRINLAWSDNTASETGFVVQRCNGSSCQETDFSEVGLTAPSALGWSDTTVCNGSTYTYRVKAVNQGLSLGGFGAWTRRTPLVFTNFQPDFQTQVTIPYNADMKANFDDIRFYDTTANMELPYWIDQIQRDGNGDPVSATVLIKTGSHDTVYLYYGNPSATAQSNGTNTFDFFDDFSTDAIDTNKWTVTDGTGFSVSNGLLHGTNTSGRLTSKSAFSAGVILEIKAKTTTIAPNGQMIGGFYLSPSDTIGWLNHPGSAYYRNDGNWVNKGDETPHDNLLYTIVAKDATTVNLQIYNLDTSAMYWNIGDLANTVANEPIALGTRFDDSLQGQVYATDWDWVRTRKYAPVMPTASIGATEQSPGFTFVVTWAGQVSNTASATTNSPDSPTVLSATRVSESRIDLAWTDNSADESGFRIERCKDADCINFAEIATVGPNVTSYSDTSGLTVNSLYRYQVRAFKTTSCGWNSSYTNIASASTDLIAPSGLTATAAITSSCEDLRFTDSDGSSLLNYFIESGCTTNTAKIWLKVPSIPTGTKQVYLYTANKSAVAMSNPNNIFDFYDDFTGTTIDSAKWVISDPGNYLSQNNELIVSGGTGGWGSSTMYSTANFDRPFVLELMHNKQPGGDHVMFGAKDASASPQYWYYHYAIYPISGTDLYAFESGNNRGGNLSPITAGVWEYYKLEVLTTGARYYVGTSPSAYSLFYDSSYSNTTPLKIGFDNHSQAFKMDNIRVRKFASAEPTLLAGNSEFGSYALTGGTWNVRRPIAITNSGAELVNYQLALTVDTTSAASDRITVQWTDNTASETGFLVERCTGSGCNFSTFDTFTVAANATSFVDKDVAYSTTYCYRVKADKSGIWTSGPTNTECATTSTPTVPTGLTAVATTKIDLSWTDTTNGEDGFIVERCTGAGCNFAPLDTSFPVTLGPNTTTYPDSTVCSDTYRYRVKSFKVGAVGWPGYSNEVEATPTSAVAPDNLTATQVSEVQIDLSWADHTTDETGFKIERCQGAGCTGSDFSQVATVGPNVTSYNDLGRLPNKTYRYRVRAYKVAVCGWDSGYSNEAEASTTVPAPANLVLTAPAATQVNLAWTDTTAAETIFKIERCDSASCNNPDFNLIGASRANTPNYSDTEVCSGTSYTYRVRAVNEGFSASGGGCWSRRVPLAITNFKPDFLVKLTIPYAAAMQNDFKDLRFIDMGTYSELPYFIESKTDGVSATISIKTDKTDAVYLYYGNPGAANVSSMVSLFGSGLMAYYPFNETDGTTSGATSDLSGSGNDLILNGFSAPYGIVSGGSYGNALSFSGGNYASNDAPNVPTGSVASIEAWIYPTGYADATYNGIVSWSNRGCYTGLALSIQNNGRPSMPTWCNDFVPGSGPTATLNTWNHVAAVLNGQSATLYVNGQLVGTTTLANLPNLSSINLAIGALEYNGRMFNGLIDEVRIYNRVLTAEEIANRYAPAIPTIALGAEEQAGGCYTPDWIYTGQPSAAQSITLPTMLAPTDLSATRASESQINVSWTDNSNDETNFVIERCTGVGCDFSTKTVFEVGASVNSYSDVGLMPNTTYQYQVKAKRVASCTSYSAYNTNGPVAAKTDLLVPAGLGANAANTTQINLSWTDTTGADTGFKVERCAGSGCSAFSQIAITAASATSYIDTTVCPGTPYTFRVRAINNGLSQDGGGCWTRRIPLTISDFQPDFQTKIALTYDGDMKADFSDIRFFDPTANVELPYWIEEKTDGASATIWVKTRVSSTIYLYFGNASATGTSSAGNTFEFYDDFAGTTINTDRWTTVGSYYTQNNGLISSGGSGAWDSGMYSVQNFNRPFVFEVSHYRTAGGSMMLGAKNTGGGINYPDFTHAAYAIYDGGGYRIQVYEDGNGRGDKKSGILSDAWQYYKLEVLATGAKYYHGDSVAAYTNYYNSGYSSANPMKVGFTNADMAFKLGNARVRKYASTEPSVAFGAKEQSGCFAFTGTYTSGYSTEASATTPLPVAPDALTATAVTDTRIDLAWTDTTADEGGFRIEQCSGSGCSSFSQIAVVAANATTYSVTGINPSLDYCFRIRATKTATCNGGWDSDYSNNACDLTFPARSTLTATPINSFMIRLDWTDTASDEGGYELEVKSYNSKWIKIKTLNANETTYTDTKGIDPLKTYTYRVRPFRGTSKSPYSNEAAATTPAYTQDAATCR